MTTKYQAKSGRRRSYDTQEEADAYDASWNDWPLIPYEDAGKARWDGYFDRETEILDRDEMRQEETRARYE